MKEFYNFLSDSRYHIHFMKQFLYGDSESYNYGLVDFKKLAVDGYNELQDYCAKKAVRTGTETAFGRFIDQRCLTVDDVNKMFSLVPNIDYQVASHTLAEGYKRLARALYQLNPKKREKIYGVAGKNKQFIGDFAINVDMVEFLNNLFEGYLHDQRERTDALNAELRTSTFVPSAASIKTIKELDGQVASMTRDYNEKVLDEKTGIKELYSAVYDYVKTLVDLGVINHNLSKVVFSANKYAPKMVDLSGFEASKLPTE